MSQDPTSWPTVHTYIAWSMGPRVEVKLAPIAIGGMITYCVFNCRLTFPNIPFQSWIFLFRLNISVYCWQKEQELFFKESVDEEKSRETFSKTVRGGRKLQSGKACAENPKYDKTFLLAHRQIKKPLSVPDVVQVPRKYLCKTQDLSKFLTHAVLKAGGMPPVFSSVQTRLRPMRQGHCGMGQACSI